MNIKCVSTYNEKKNQTVTQYEGMSHKHFIVKSLDFYFTIHHEYNILLY